MIELHWKDRGQIIFVNALMVSRVYDHEGTTYVRIDGELIPVKECARDVVRIIEHEKDRQTRVKLVMEGLTYGG